MGSDKSIVFLKTSSIVECSKLCLTITKSKLTHMNESIEIRCLMSNLEYVIVVSLIKHSTIINYDSRVIIYN